jgi:hypothetical protein
MSQVNVETILQALRALARERPSPQAEAISLLIRKPVSA